MNEVWQVFVQSDMTEGRGGLVPFGGIFLNEQDAWDSINHLPGVMGRRVGKNCWPTDRLRMGGATTWQDYKEIVGSAGDYDVRPLVVAGRQQPQRTHVMEELIQLYKDTA